MGVNPSYPGKEIKRPTGWLVSTELHSRTGYKALWLAHVSLMASVPDLIDPADSNVRYSYIKFTKQSVHDSCHLQR